MIDMTKLPTATIYITGGYVRDRILNRECKDHDYVVCGATPEEMIAAGFVPIEATSFPVFLHPQTKDEFALARKEKKVGDGYHGFECFYDPTVTVEEDLYRRDVTMNSMARKVIGWNELGHAILSDEIIDPFGGQQDLKENIIRHTSEAFNEDPVRVLRVARFATRYGFCIATETWEWMSQMVKDGELNHLTAERVWLETHKAMSDSAPFDYFTVLSTIAALEVVMPQLPGTLAKVYHPVRSLVADNSPVEYRFAALTSCLSSVACAEFYEKLKAPSNFTRLAVRVNKLLSSIEPQCETDANWAISALEMLNAFQPDSTVVQDCTNIISRFQFNPFERVLRVLNEVHHRTKDVRFNTLEESVQKLAIGPAIGAAIRKVRIDIAEQVIASTSI